MLERSSLWLAACADATDPNGFGGLPYHLLSSGNAKGLISGGFPFRIDGPAIKLARLLWNAAMFARSGNIGGFQYSEIFLRILWSSADMPSGNYDVLNIFQLYPESEMMASGSRSFYLDQTLHEVFSYYRRAETLSHDWADEVLMRENAQYHAAHRVVFRSKWAAEKAIEKYGLNAGRVSVVLPGANIEASALREFDREKPSIAHDGEPLRLIFIGKEWKRKGLDRLLRAMRLVEEAGFQISLTVIGAKESDLPDGMAKGLHVEWLGFVDKSLNPKRFVRLVSRHDVGVLLSRSEAGGVSLREFGRLGLPVIAPNTGGSPEFAMSSAARLVEPKAGDEAIAEILINFAHNRRELSEIKGEAWSRRRLFDWGLAVERLSDVL